MYYAKWMEKLAKQDTKLGRAQRHKTLWYLNELSGMMICWEPKYYIWNLLYVGVGWSTQLYVLVTVFMTMFCVDELAELGQCINICSLLIISGAMTVTAHWKRETIMMGASLEAQGYYNYGDTLNLKELENLKKVFTVMRKVIVVLLPSYFLLVVAVFVFSKHLDAWFGYDTTATEDYINGVYQHLPIKIKPLLPVDTDFQWLVSLSIELTAGGAMGMTFSWSTASLTHNTQQLYIQMKTLIIAIRETDSRADVHYASKTGKKPPSDPILRRKDPALMKSYRACIKQTMQHHKVILYFFQMFRDFCYWPTGISVVNGAVLLAMSSITLIKGGGRPSMILTSVLLIVGEAASLAVMCEMGQVIQDMNEKIFYSMYQFRWMDCSKDIITDVRFMMTKMSMPLIMVGILTPLNRDTFATMINTSYSYMNVVRAS